MRNFSAFALLLLVTAALGACDDPTGDDAGTISMLLTDAPGEFTQARVTIERIELMHDGEENEEQGGRIILRDEPWTGNLLELSNDVVELVESAVVPSGAYHQLRFVISGGCIVVDGEGTFASAGYTECGTATGTLQMPSFAQTGLKVNLPAGFRVSGDDRILLVDFDVAESFGRLAGASGMWVMQPVVTATEIVTSGSLEVTVTVAGDADLPDDLTAESFSVQLGEEPEVAVIDGVATFFFLVPGTYSIDLVAPDGVTVTTDPELPIDVEIGSSEDAEREITITGTI
ncbi:MAG TPA: DUF4382 domain-containing protein [Longimicrobiales bacterium]|nr:DUF4382 domain-containing protein [Longimicrobiales bacterium]